MAWMTRAITVAALMALAACAHEERAGAAVADGAVPGDRAPRAERPRVVAPPTGADSAAARAKVAATADSARSAFARGTRLGAREVGELRLDVNAKQVATARSLGIRAGSEGEIRRLVDGGQLVELADSTAFWILRDMDHSVPVTTPDARAMLEELGRRFHARLDSLGLPRYRMKVTSAIRTGETQADLRRINSYASRTASAHEFGTTVDVSHERFAVPVAATPLAEEEADSLQPLADDNARVLQAALGRAILSMREDGLLHVMMENQQPVYHMTVAKRMAR